MREVVNKFYADRGTHLAAMIAYFALLSFVPLLFLALALIGLIGEPSESSYLIEQLRRAFPATSIDRLLAVVRSIEDRALELGVVGVVGLLWATLGFFSVLESAFNIVYGLPNRPFVRQKLLVVVLVAAALAGLVDDLLVEPERLLGESGPAGQREQRGRTQDDEQPTHGHLQRSEKIDSTDAAGVRPGRAG